MRLKGEESMRERMLWRNEKTEGMEYFILNRAAGIEGKGSIIYLAEDGPHTVQYTVRLDENWLTREVLIQADQGRSLILQSDGNGRWTDGGGMSQKHIEGALDIDISATPFTNSLPINRERWEQGEQKQFQMVYISVPGLQVKKVNQMYTYLKTEDGLRYFKYESSSYHAQIAVDNKGFVVHYPGLFSRSY